MKGSIVICFAISSVVLAEVPTLPNIDQWKVPLFHKREKENFHVLTYVPLVQPTQTHKETKEFVEKLEYNAQNELQESADLGLTILDLNSVLDEELSKQVADGVEVEIAKIDQEAGETAQAEIIELPNPAIVPTLLMHQGRYVDASDLNSIIDGLVKETKRIITRRDMDPLYFTVHRRGIVRHKPGDAVLESGRLSPTFVASNTTDNTKKNNNPLGGGIITGLSKLKRFGNVEKRETENGTLMRSHFSYGPLRIDLVFETKEGLRMVNSTLSNLAGHGLFSTMDNGNKLELLEFVIDSPMEYEIRMKTSRNQRLRNVSQSAITRLFKRSGRMEKRLQRCFERATRKPVPDLIKNIKKQVSTKSSKPITKKLMKLNEMKQT